MHWQKRFNVGLCLDTNIQAMRRLLDRYCDFIHSFYFSVPLGRRFQSRAYIAKQYESKERRLLLWELLKLIRSYGINLELALNTPHLTGEDLSSAFKILEDHEVEIDSVVALSEYAESIVSIRSGMKLVYSFNNPNHSLIDYLKHGDAFSCYVVGRNNIRNTRLFSQIIELTGGEITLLLNNGCNVFCPGCSKEIDCRDYFNKTVSRKPITPEELYALSSIMPFEIHEGLLDTKDVALFKISSRNGTAGYIEKCLDSYINNTNAVTEPRDYLLWSRLAPFFEFFPSFDLEKIIMLKRNYFDDGEVKCISQTI